MFRPTIVALSTIALLATAGCSTARSNQGYLADLTLVDSIRPNVDNRESVQRTLGRPTFAGQFDARDWYYVARQTQQLAFRNPRPVQQTVMRIRFDEAGNVIAIDKTGVEKVASIRPNGDKTATLGKDRSFFEELFGNIGQVGSVGRGGGTADNPDGGE
jgi:outer membrane protein assembly factor BamE (lipoprotein component of BamABCDE complex)